jgi:hypothetical protein
MIEGPPSLRCSTSRFKIVTSLPSADDQAISPFFSEETGHDLAVHGGNLDGLEPLLDDLRRSQDRLDQRNVGDFPPQLRQVGADRIDLAFDPDMALHAVQGRLEEEGRAPNRIASFSNGAGQGLGRFFR